MHPSLYQNVLLQVFKLHVHRGRHDNWFVFRRYTDFVQLQNKVCTSKGHSSESSSPSPSLRFTVFTSIKALSLFYRRSVLLSYMNFCLFLCMRWHFEMVVYSKRKNLLPEEQSFSFLELTRTDNGGKKIVDRHSPL